MSTRQEYQMILLRKIRLLKEEEDLNDYSEQEDEDHPKYNWDDQEYQMNLICFINEDKIIDT